MTLEWNGGVAVVDDEQYLTDLIVRMLELKSIPVCFKAYDGQEAVQKFRECNPKPEVIIMDYRLPAMTGIEAMKQIMRTDSNPKFIFLSADTGVREEALQAGAVLFIVKPTSMKDLIGAVEDVAGRL